MTSEKPAQAPGIKSAYTLKVAKKHNPVNDADYWVFHLKDIDEAAYLAAWSYIKAGKEADAVRFLVRELHVGGDPIDEWTKDFKAVLAVRGPVLEIASPYEATLKKN